MSQLMKDEREKGKKERKRDTAIEERTAVQSLWGWFLQGPRMKFLWNNMKGLVFIDWFLLKKAKESKGEKKYKPVTFPSIGHDTPCWKHKSWFVFHPSCSLFSIAFQKSRRAARWIGSLVKGKYSSKNHKLRKKQGRKGRKETLRGLGKWKEQEKKRRWKRISWQSAIWWGFDYINREGRKSKWTKRSERRKEEKKKRKE